MIKKSTDKNIQNERLSVLQWETLIISDSKYNQWSSYQTW